MAKFFWMAPVQLLVNHLAFSAAMRQKAREIKFKYMETHSSVSGLEDSILGFFSFKVNIFIFYFFIDI